MTKWDSFDSFAPNSQRWKNAISSAIFIQFVFGHVSLYDTKKLSMDS
jgi:hypothetical protein